MSSTSARQLFGGAITVNLPTRLIDASDLREVPDTQEVFLYPESSVSVILEVLQRVEPDGNEDAAKFHFQSLAEDNSADSSVVHEVGVIPNDRGDDTPSPIVLYGSQMIRKFNHQVADEVRILVALYRIKSKNVDLVMTCNIPVKTIDTGAVSEDGFQAAQSDFNAAAHSLRIVDYGLFA